MHIQSVTVRGFRSIHDQRVNLGRLSYFIGRNNAGKSNLISALRFLLEGGKLTIDDFYRSGDQQVTNVLVYAVFADVQVAIEELGKANQTKLAQYVDGGKLVVRRLATRENLGPKIELQDPGDPRMWSTPTGIDAALKVLFPTVVSLETFKDPNDELGSKSTASLQKLIKTASASVASNLGDLRDALRNIDSKLNATDGGDERADQIIKIEEDINAKLEQFLSNQRIRLHFGLPQMNDLISKASIRIGSPESGWFETGQQGQGFQRLMVFALLTVLSERLNDDQSPLLILFEEPESFLHPNLQRQLATTLQSLSRRHQILAVTHSPIFVHDAESLERVHRVALSPEGSKYLCCADHDFLALRDNKLLHAFSLQNTAEYLFADEVIVVEGVSDQTILSATLSTCPPAGALPAERAIVQINGKDAVKDWILAFKSLGLPTKALVDLDFFWNGAGAFMVGNVDFQRLLEKFKADLSGQGAWLPERGKLVDGRKRDAFEWLVVNGGEQLVRIREDLRTRCNIWMLANGEMEDQLTPRYNKSNYPSLPGKIEAGEATVSEELVSLMKWLVCPVEAAEMQPV